jgi:hypothetical protein
VSYDEVSLFSELKEVHIWQILIEVGCISHLQLKFWCLCELRFLGILQQSISTLPNPRIYYFVANFQTLNHIYLFIFFLNYFRRDRCQRRHLDLTQHIGNPKS